MRIGVIGSMQLTELMLELCKQLQLLGHEAFMSGFAARYVGKTDEEKEQLKLHHKYNCDAIREFWQAMQGADAVLVANAPKNGQEGYIGGNTFLECGFAHVLGQKVYLLFSLDPKLPYAEYIGTELAAMKPTVLNGDLSLIL